MRDEREARARLLLGRLLSDLGKGECAAELLREAVRYMPEQAAAHVELGMVYSGLGRYVEMLGEFREAIRLDVRAVRRVVRVEPKELVELRSILYPPRETPPPARRDWAPPIPTHVYASSALVEQGVAEMAAGRDGQAVDFLVRALRLDPSCKDAVTMLALAYLLSRESEGKVSAGNEGSVLWEIAPGLAEVLFKEGEAGDRSHTDGQG